MKKNERLAAIKTIVATQKISTQQELSQALAEEGITLTQATISRLISEAGILKFSEPDGSFYYGFAGQTPSWDNQAAVHKHLLAVSQKGELLHLQVVPGTSKVIKRQLLTDYAEAIFSVIADDDSLLLVAQSLDSANHLAQLLAEDI